MHNIESDNLSILQNAVSVGAVEEGKLIESTLKILNTALKTWEINMTQAKEMFAKLFPDKKLIYVVDALQQLMLYREGLFFDVCSDQYFIKDTDFVTIIRKNNKFFRVHGDYVNDDIAFYCERNRKYYYSREYTAIRCERKKVCKECTIVFLHRDGRYYFSPEIIPLVEQQPVVHTELANYHAIHRPAEWKQAQGIGMELEIKCDDRIALLNRLPKDIIAERDGSLCEEKGIELIGKPYTYEEYRDGKTPWKEVVDAANDIGSMGYTAGRNYGIHLSVSRSLFKSSLHAAKFIVFFNQQAKLVKCVAQRSNIYNGGYGVRKKVSDACALEFDIDSYNPTDGSYNKKIKIQTKKYEPVYADDKRLEVRVFRSSIVWKTILKNVEFVQAVFDFVRNASITVVSDDTKGTTDFIKWLNNQKDFPNLKKFLLNYNK